MKLSQNYDLDMTVDEQSWLLEHPIYCPVPWCNAHNLRGVRCGDWAGDYEGIHVARIRAVPREARRVAQEVEILRRCGHADPELTLGLLRMQQDAVDSGSAKGGRKGRRNLVPRALAEHDGQEEQAS